MTTTDSTPVTGGANTYQVGGNHYQNDYQHWDFVVDARLGYLEGVATKYLQRWRRKNGLEDLEKARHYIIKLIEVHSAGRVTPPAAAWPAINALRIGYIGRFLPGVEGVDERQAVALLANWAGANDLHAALALVGGVIEAEKAAAPDGAYVDQG